MNYLFYEQFYIAVINRPCPIVNVEVRTFNRIVTRMRRFECDTSQINGNPFVYISYVTTRIKKHNKTPAKP